MTCKVYFIYGGKGGVGKSTTTYNVAYELKNKGNSVAVLDLDFKTPSLYRLFAGDKEITRHPEIDSDMKIKPAEVDGILIQSTGFINNNMGMFFNDGLVDGALYQFLHPSMMEVDYLLVDLPPSIEKIHSLVCQKFKKAEFILISTYSLLSLEDTQKAFSFINKLGHKTKFIIMNMSYIQCVNCKERAYLFNRENMDVFDDLKRLNTFELPFSKELIDFNEHSQSVYDIGDDNLQNCFINIVESM